MRISREAIIKNVWTAVSQVKSLWKRFLSSAVRNIVHWGNLNSIVIQNLHTVSSRNFDVKKCVYVSPKSDEYSHKLADAFSEKFVKVHNLCMEILDTVESGKTYTFDKSDPFKEQPEKNSEAQEKLAKQNSRRKQKMTPGKVW